MREKKQAEGFKMYPLSMKNLKRKRVFLKITKRAKQIIDEKNDATKREIQNEINNAIKIEQSFTDKSIKCITPSKDLKAITKSVDCLKQRFSEITDKKKHIDSKELIELKDLIKNVKKIISDLKHKKK
jgi:hypothetical protein